jgi:hypothetical protein
MAGPALFARRADRAKWLCFQQLVGPVCETCRSRKMVVLPAACTSFSGMQRRKVGSRVGGQQVSFRVACTEEDDDRTVKIGYFLGSFVYGSS